MSNLFFKKSGNRVPLSPQESSNSLKYNDLGDFPLKNGAQTSQQQSLYDALEALCKEKKCLSSNQPLSLITYLPGYARVKNG